jgi:kynureninase
MSHKTSTTAFVVDDSHGVEVAMRKRGVLPSARGPVIRLAPHFYNTIADVDTALDVLTAVLAGA